MTLQLAYPRKPPAQSPLRHQTEILLQTMLGKQARFRDGQWEAIRELVESRSRALVVQKTGWGKSVVYFLATRLLRDQGAGPTLLISPLLSLMRNQVEMAERLGIRAETINCSNKKHWQAVEQALADDRCDLLLVSPERLASMRFLRETLPRIERAIGLFVVDEAHCISDWGHDFRPDYRRIVRIAKLLPANVPMLATTATANNRVIADIQQQLGPDLKLQRGPLARETLVLQSVLLPELADRLAWLADNLPGMAGSGIVYCLTVADCERVATWLRKNGIDAQAYHASLGNDERVELEQRLLANSVKVLVATVALGMGFDKPDLGFVIHFQRPGSVIAYYQQIGRAGRAVRSAFAVLLNGDEDDSIHEHFMRSAFPYPEDMEAVADALQQSRGMRPKEILKKVNMGWSRLEQVLKLLEVDGAILREGNLYVRTANPWTPDEGRAFRVTQQRRAELNRMKDFVRTRRCLMQFMLSELDDPQAAPCGRCANCSGPAFPYVVNRSTAEQARDFLEHEFEVIAPRKYWPQGSDGKWQGRIPSELQNKEGRALCFYGDPGWGEQVRNGKYVDGHYSRELVTAAARMIRVDWQPKPSPQWVACVPSLRHPDLVPAFARALAVEMGLPYRQALVKTRATEEQKLMLNSAHRIANLSGSLKAIRKEVSSLPVLLVDDMVDSGWTLTACGVVLRMAGCEAVHPFALAMATARKDNS